MKKTLIIEDDIYLAEVLKDKFTRANFEARTVASGDKVDAILQDYTPDVILLDLLLPKRDGFTLLEDLKGNDKYSAIPLIILTNLQDTQLETDCLMKGANLFLVKVNTPIEKVVEHAEALIKNH